jgi:RNA methyltransferase, TrmH family
MKTIHSRDNAFAKHLIALAHSSRERKKSGHTVLDGAHLVDAYVASPFAANANFSVAIRESAIDSPDAISLLKKLDANTANINLLADALMDEASALDSPASIMAVIDTPPSQPIPADARAVIVCDAVQDPGNVGSILRSAAAFGFTHAFLGAGTAFAWSPKVLRAGQGAHFAVNIVEGGDVAAWLETYRGNTIALVPNKNAATPLAQIDLNAAVAILVGSEGAGLSEDIINAATTRATIPMSGKMESLNAAACAGIAMYEWQRQQTKRNST